ncbi:carotenoid ester lipase precursor [Vararia minispora EC-137]|uniref:Carotenoid ester lipase n=1 Tax=Vararia minispora EC-137 TaxID=1314806 RepID=A0ACB8QF29_9AGAM|nr:carotenoid ester lipase precursor [Vararia minispora EC-137]
MLHTFAFLFVAAVYGASPTVVLDRGIFTGVASGTTEAFLGIPFAQPPVGDLRFRAPEPNAPYTGSFNATVFGPACVQQSFGAPNEPNINSIALEIIQSTLANPPLVDDEDCLSINVFKPANTTSALKLPVVYWIFGGGFETGSNSMFNGSVIVERSLELGMPVVYVSVNYRLSALGFPMGIETRKAGNGNLGFLDQRQGLRWVQKYIGKFGGDPTKVMIWGVSSGAISVTAQMLMNNGDTEGLFRAAFAQSGSPVPTSTVEDNQAVMDIFVDAAGCGHESGSPAVFDCLRKLSLEGIRTAMSATPGLFAFTSIALGWNPVADGVTIPAPFQQMVLHSNIANVPLISGDCDDEGTMFTLANTNITTSAEFEDYITKFWAAGNRAIVEPLFAAYPDDPALGSPFDTGTTNNITSQFKRMASITGDLVFQAPRRFFFERVVKTQPVFSYISKRLKSTPVLGAFHSSDLSNVYGPGDMTDYLIRFAVTLDPNGSNTNTTEIHWPRYTLETRQMLTFLDGNVSLAIGEDTFREEAIEKVMGFALAHPFP